MRLKSFCVLGHDTVAKRLIAYGSNVSATNSYGNTALHLAADYGDKIKTKRSHYQKELKEICILGHYEVMMRLIDHGSNVSAINSYGETPFHWAARLGIII